MLRFRTDARIAAGTSLWLDLFRGLAALEVLSGHLFPMVFGDRPRPPGVAGDITGAIGLLSSKSHQAVIIFFALSGFLVGGPFLIKALQGRADPRSYAIARLSRLYTVVIPALALTLLLDGIGMAWLNGQAFVDARAFFFPDQTHLGPATAACNLAFLQSLYCAPLGSNGSLWSLSNEAFYYALWLALVMGMTRRRWLLAAAAIAAIVALGPMADVAGYAIFFAIWMSGALVFALHRAKATGVAAALLLLSPLALVHGSSIVVSDIGLAAAFLAILLTIDARALRFPLPERPVRRVAEMSFSLYAAHLPIGIFLLLLLGIVAPLQRSFAGLAVFGLVVALTMAGAALFFWTFERHTGAVRTRLLAIRGLRASLPTG